MAEKLTINRTTIRSGITFEMDANNVDLFFGEKAAKKMKKILKEKQAEHTNTLKIVDVDFETKIVTFEAVK